jgi:hypothetical protein
MYTCVRVCESEIAHSYILEDGLARLGLDFDQLHVVLDLDTTAGSNLVQRAVVVVAGREGLGRWNDERHIDLIANARFTQVRISEVHDLLRSTAALDRRWWLCKDHLHYTRIRVNQSESISVEPIATLQRNARKRERERGIC